MLQEFCRLATHEAEPDMYKDTDKEPRALQLFLKVGGGGGGGGGRKPFWNLRDCSV